MAKQTIAWGFALIVLSCGDSNSSSSKITATTKLLSTTLSQTRSLMSRACGTSFCATPTQLSGKVYYAGIMVGADASGNLGSGGGYSLGPIIGEVNDPSKLTAFESASLLDFDFANSKTLDGSPTCCGGSPYPSDTQSYPASVDIYFSYVDATFKITSGTMQGTWVVRTVFGDINGTSYKKGDLLIRSSSETDFQWCDSTSTSCAATRPTTPVAYAEIKNYAGSGDGLGNQTIPTFSVKLSNPSESKFPQAEVVASSYKFDFDFTMTDAIEWQSNPANFANRKEILSNFKFASEIGKSGSSKSFSVKLTTTRTAKSTTTAR